MNHLKQHARDVDGLTHFLTYADNNAVGYFIKQVQFYIFDVFSALGFLLLLPAICYSFELWRNHDVIIF